MAKPFHCAIITISYCLLLSCSPDYAEAQKKIDTPFGQITPKADGFNFKGRFLEVDRSKDATVLKSPLGEIRKDKFRHPYVPLANIPPRPEGLQRVQFQLLSNHEVIVPPYRFAEDVGVPQLGAPAADPGGLTPNLGEPATSPNDSGPLVPQLGTPGQFDNDNAAPPEPKPPKRQSSGLLIPNLGAPESFSEDTGQTETIPQKNASANKGPLVPVLGEAQTFDGKPLTVPPGPMPPVGNTEPGKFPEQFPDPNPSYVILPCKEGAPQFQVSMNGVALASYAKPSFTRRGRPRRIANLVVPAGGVINAAVKQEKITLEPMWLEEVPALFQPIAGVHVLAFVHPVTKKTTAICVDLPAGKPTIEIMAREVEFDYGDSDVEIEFKLNGGVRVKYNR